MKELTLGDRMKTYYENRSQTYLTRYTPAVVRLDGCHFRTFTKGFEKPFDKLFAKAMQMTAKYLCEHIQGVKFAYTQSDEISLILVDYNKEDLSIQTEAWFDYKVQKICSVAASLATLAFNNYFNEFYLLDLAEKGDVGLTEFDLAHDMARRAGATFDARAFSLPKDEVVNYLIFRQADAIRNSKSALGQANYSQKVLNGLSSAQIVEKCKTELNVDWNEFKGEQKWGTIFYKAQLEGERPKWTMDNDPKLFNELRDEIENLI